MNRAGILRVLFLLVALCGIIAWILPWILYATSETFEGRLPATLLFFAVISEKLWSSFLRMPERVSVAAEKDWTVIAVGLAYAAVVFPSLLAIYTRRSGFPSLLSGCAGGVAYSSGLALRLVALKTLGQKWSIQLDQPVALDTSIIVREGPYRWIRHPIYLGAIIETLGIALLFGSGWAIGAACCLFWPAELARARFEEKYLHGQYGEAYAKYSQDVPGFIPRFGARSQ